MTNPQPEIPAQHIPIAQEIIWRTLVLPAVRKEFCRVRIMIEGSIPEPQDGPLIIYLTHSSWWDAYMLFVIHYYVLKQGFQNYIMMEAKQLRAYRFFAWCGAFSIDPKNPEDVGQSLGYIANRLREQKDRCLWIFPQGRIVPPDRRPIVALPGIARIVAQSAGAVLWPIALRYEFRGEQQPEALIYCGPPHTVQPDTTKHLLIGDIRTRLTAAADTLRTDLLSEQTDSYRVLIEGRQGINRWFDTLRTKLPGQSANRKQ